MKLSFRKRCKLFVLILTEKIWMRQYSTNRNRWIFFLWLNAISNYVRNITKGSLIVAFSPKVAYPYYQGVKKSRLNILLDNIIWAIKFNETNLLYYVYGMDNVDSKLSDFISYPEFRVMRNIINIKQRENRPQDGYIYNYIAITRDKFIFCQFCQSLSIPHPQVYGITNFGTVWWIGFDGTDYVDFDTISSLPDFDSFVKDTAGEMGKNAYRLTKLKDTLLINGKPVTFEELNNSIRGGQFIIQQRIIQHPVLEKIYPNSVNTMRIETFLDDQGRVHVLDAIIRFGTRGRVVDNWGAGGILVGVDIDTGVMSDIAFYKPGFGSLIRDIHPDTGESFAGIEVPHFQEALQHASTLHKALYGIPSMGWDITIDEDGPVFIEAGEDWDVAVQMCKKGLRDIFFKHHLKALDYKMKDLL